MLTAGGDYTASLLLFDDVWNTLSQSVEGDIVAAVPSRDVVLFTGARSTDGIEWIKRKAHEIHEGGDHVVSQTLFRRVSGEWKLSPVCDNYYYRSLISAVHSIAKLVAS